MDEQVAQLKQHIAELVEGRREWMGRFESRIVSEPDIKEIEDTAGALGAAIEALDSLKFEIEKKINWRNSGKSITPQRQSDLLMRCWHGKGE